MSDFNDAQDRAYEAISRGAASIPIVGWISYLLYLAACILLLTGFIDEAPLYVVWGVSALLTGVFFGAMSRIIRLLSQILIELRDPR